MAAALIGEALISASIEVSCDRVTSAEFIDLFRQEETRRITSHEPEHDTVDFVREDLLDEIDTEALRCKLEGEDQTHKLTNKEDRRVFDDLKGEGCGGEGS
ncbi:PREDICTED: disease resistance RPP13 1 [Prunus dulcis]|uniref:PREDICTED: disease resistance RPP13 1 n=1 Tax=Prunus dulcis TaxID=3755 RepID=A0A5E4FTT4_PRUDU|nr:PREDICTED: disease resistance RPP13 1 [Prunus dulcis]